nr:cytochrome c biogenesis heme-transporting ATPase CcmA [Pseudomonas quercus]
MNPPWWPPTGFDVTVHLEGLALACERDGRLLFEGLDVSLRAGDLVKITGPNGAGKTSLLRLLSGLAVPSAGQVRFNGQPLPTALRALAAQLVWLGHAPAIKLSLTAHENLAGWGALGRPSNPAAIDQALHVMGLGGYEDQPCQHLSAGQQRRVALARLYLDAPPVWLLDEPFTSLDGAAVSQLERRLAEHCEAGGLVAFTSHHELAIRPSSYRAVALGGVA